MATEVLAAILRANLVGAAAILVVLIVRIPARRMFGPHVAYWLWCAPPLAAFATLLPPRTEDGAAARNALAAAVDPVSAPALLIWTIGAGLLIGLMVSAQRRFLREVTIGRGGPAVVGVISPRIVMPADDGAYTDEERALIRAHERAHVARQDPRAGALASVLQAACWFNPLVHVAAHVMRLDQELACDAAVLRRQPFARALYARTLLKAQLASQPLPFGCYWPAPGRHPLEVRIGELRDTRIHDGLVGPLLIAATLALCAYAGWRVQPPAPRPAAMVELWRTNAGGPTMSVLLIDAPRKTPNDPTGA
jgi:beta-lactamase regulating signal transducer with metallopeptidase domain